jgi:pyroglutamyl-peptidase
MRVLISGFEAFGGETINPTERLVRQLADIECPRGVELHGVCLPVVFEASFQLLRAHIQRVDPKVVLAFGQAGGRSMIEIERVAINCIDADIPDNHGNCPRDQRISPSGESAYFTTLPAQEMIAQLERDKIPARMSNTAGTFVCNDLFYRLQEFTRFSMRHSGFIHVPYLPEQAVTKGPGTAAMEFDTLKRSLEAILRSL